MINAIASVLKGLIPVSPSIPEVKKRIVKKRIIKDEIDVDLSK